MNIGFEEILGLVFFIFFVVVPLFSKKNKPQSRGGPPAGGAPTSSPRPGAPDSGAAGSGAPAASGGPRPGGPVTADARQAEPGSWREILAEVQRRVAEAEVQESGGSATPPEQRRSTSGMPQARSTTTLAPERTSGSLVSGRTSSASASGGGLVTSDPFGGGLVSGVPAPASMGREGMMSSPLAAAEPLRVTRLGGRSRQPEDPDVATVTPRRRGQAVAARMGAPTPEGPKLLRTGRDDILRGMIWHEILSEPAALKRSRRTTSRRQ